MKIKELRKSKRLTQKDLADFLETSPQVVSRYERGEHQPDISTLIKLADFFCVTVDYLIGATTKGFGATNSPTLTSQEKSLLNYFDKLDEYQRESIMIQVKALAEKAEHMVK